MDYGPSKVVVNYPCIRSLKFVAHLLTHTITSVINDSRNCNSKLWPIGISREICKYVLEPSEEYLQTRINLISYSLQKYFQKSNLIIALPPAIVHQRTQNDSQNDSQKVEKESESLNIAKWQQLIYNNIQPMLKLKKKIAMKIKKSQTSNNVTPKDLKSQELQLIEKDTLLEWIYSSFEDPEIANDSFVISYFSYIIALYAGGYGWFPSMNDSYIRYTHQGRIAYYKPARDVACMVADEEIMASANYMSSIDSQSAIYLDMEDTLQSNSSNIYLNNESTTDEPESNGNQSKYYFCQLLVREKADEMWIGITWDYTMLAIDSWAGVARDGKCYIAYYGGRKLTTAGMRLEIAIAKIDDDMHAAFKKELQDKYNNHPWDMEINVELQKLKMQFDIEVTADDVLANYNDSGALYDSAYGAIHAFSTVHSTTALRYYEDGDIVGVLVNCSERWVQFFNNGVAQGEHVSLPKNVGRFWLYGTADASTDQVIFDRQIWKAKKGASK